MTQRPRFEVLAMGEVLIRLAAPSGSTLESADHLDVTIGGAEANVAVALARMGRSVAWMSRVADDPFGRRVLGELRRHGVSCEPVQMVTGARTGLYFTESGGAPRGVSVQYDRNHSAAMGMSVDTIDISWVDQADLVVVSGITPALSDGCAHLCSAVLDRAAKSGRRTVVDVNYRAKLWSPERARAVLAPLCASATVVVCTAEDARDVFGVGEADPARVAAAVSARTVVLTEGSRGVSWTSPGGSGFSPAIPTETHDRIGAGDAFCAGVVMGVLDGDLATGIRRGQAMASLARTVRGDQFLGTPTEVAAVLAADGRTDRR